MALTLGNLRSFLQTKLGDTTDDTKTLIDQMINAAYMSIVTRLKSFWLEKSGEVLVENLDSSVDLPEDCYSLIRVERPAAFTTSPPLTIVTQEDWETFRRPVSVIDEPLALYAGGYSGSTTKQMKLGIYPACATAYTGSYPIWYYALPGVMTTDADVPVFDERHDDLLLTECQVRALDYEGRYEEAGVLKQRVNDQLGILSQIEDSAAEKK